MRPDQVCEDCQLDGAAQLRLGNLSPEIKGTNRQSSLCEKSWRIFPQLARRWTIESQRLLPDYPFLVGRNDQTDPARMLTLFNTNPGPWPNSQRLRRRDSWNTAIAGK
jgi:hypothetical protein